MPEHLNNAVVVITGASSGIGAATARAAAEDGWNLVLAARSADKLETLVREIGEDRACAVACDVTDFEDQQRMVDAAVERFGRLDVLVNNAGVASGGFFDELSLEDWDWQIAINLMGVVKGCKAFLPLVQKSKGKIINIASMAALMQAPGMSNYNVAKAGVVALSESLMVELRQAEVGVHVVCPSFFQTNLLDSFRGPTPNVKAQIGKLLESSPITAADIADYIHQQVAKGEFMILPHEEGRMAWKVKQQNPQAIYDEMALLAEKKRAKSKAV